MLRLHAGVLARRLLEGVVQLLTIGDRQLSLDKANVLGGIAVNEGGLDVY